jgi:hypothetical protein
MSPASPLLRWVGQAARAFGWRDAALAAGLSVFVLAFGNSGGYFLISLTEGTNPLFDPAKTYGKTLLTSFIGRTLPLVFTLRVAEVAIADGVRPWRAYLAALLVTLACSQAVLHLPIGRINRAAEHVGRHVWFLITYAFQFGTIVVIYALWRAGQRTNARVRASEAARAQDLQRLQSAELLALQARVDPQLLFDALGRVGALQIHDPPAADRLLTDLIALLRAMLPRWADAGSTIEREFAVVRRWLQVTRALRPDLPRVAVTRAERASRAAIAPMLALPMLRSVIDAPEAVRCTWQLDAEAAGGRLLVTLTGSGCDTDPGAGAPLDLGPLHERLALLHGESARLWVTAAPPLLVLDLPLVERTGAESALADAA